MKFQINHKVVTAACLSCFLLGTSLNANAWGLSDASSLLGGGDSSSIDTSQISESSKTLVDQFKFSMKAINYAQAEALEAFNMVDEAEKARLDAKAIDSGVADGEAGDKLVENTQSRNALILQKSKGQQKLTGAARKHLAKSAAMYAGSSYAGVKILGGLEKWFPEAQSALTSMSKDPMNLGKFKETIEPGIYVMSKLPELSSSWVKTSKVLVDYAAVNGDKIDTSKEQKTISKELGLEG